MTKRCVSAHVLTIFVANRRLADVVQRHFAWSVGIVVARLIGWPVKL